MVVWMAVYLAEHWVAEMVETMAASKDNLLAALTVAWWVVSTVEPTVYLRAANLVAYWAVD